MSLRIIAGRFGGRLIAAPDGKVTHPMSQRARGALFNSLGEIVKGARVLDAFAGSGAVGLEALSRGAAHVTFIEQHKQVAATLSHNIAALKVEAKAVLIKTSVENWFETAKSQLFDIIIADPPYGKLRVETIEKLFSLLNPNGLLVLSHSSKDQAPVAPDGITFIDERHYAAATLSFYRRLRTLLDRGR